MRAYRMAQSEMGAKEVFSQIPPVSTLLPCTAIRGAISVILERKRYGTLESRSHHCSMGSNSTERRIHHGGAEFTALHIVIRSDTERQIVEQLMGLSPQAGV